MTDLSIVCPNCKHDLDIALNVTQTGPTVSIANVVDTTPESTPDPTPTPSPTPKPTGRDLLLKYRVGGWFNNDGAGGSDAEFGKWKNAQIRTYFAHWPTLPVASMQRDIVKGVVPLVNLALTSPDQPATDTVGLTKVMQQAKTIGMPFMLRLAGEFNRRGWDPVRFKDGWQKFYTTLLGNTPWCIHVWCPTGDGFTRTDSHEADLYYPGDSYVDWIGVDAYCWPGAKYQELSTLLAPGLNYASKHKKPVAACEFGIDRSFSDAQRAQWFTNAMKYAQSGSNGVPLAWAYFMAHAPNGDWRVLSNDKQTYPAFNDWLASASGK